MKYLTKHTEDTAVNSSISLEESNPVSAPYRLPFLASCLIGVFTFLLSFAVKAQTYPVQSSLQLTPPYQLQLPAYTASGSEQLVLNALLTDVSRAQLDVTLRVTIEGQGLRITTSPTAVFPAITLLSGISSRLSGTELAPYFLAENLQFSGYSSQEYSNSGGMLPEGFYLFCIEVVEANRQVSVARQACTSAWLILNDPPIINLPTADEVLTPADPQFVRFQWTPRHTGSPNSAFTTEYHFELVEVWPEGRNINDAFLTTIPIYEATTLATSLVYGPAEPALVRGRQYAFRVQARSIVGIDQLDLFRNDGYSEVQSFTYGDECFVPEGFALETPSSRKISVLWDADLVHTGFLVRHRVAGTADWTEAKVLFEDHTLEGLLPDTSYEVQLLGSCGLSLSIASETLTIKTPAALDSDFSCGSPPESFNLDNSTPLPQLNKGDVIQAGDFDVSMVDVSGSNGTFSGTGQLVLPMMNLVKASVEFSNIKVNDEYRMYDGMMNFTGTTVQALPDEILDQINSYLDDFLALEGDIIGALDLAEEVADSLNAIVEEIQNTDVFTAEEFTEMVSPETTLEDLQEARDAALAEAVEAISNGDLVAAATAVVQAQAINNHAKAKSQQAAEVDTVSVAAVSFVRGGNAVDLAEPLHDAIEPQYYKVVTTAGADAYGPWFATAAGQSATIVAEYISNDSIPKADITFILGEEEIEATSTREGWELTIPAGDHNEHRVLKARHEDRTVGIGGVASYTADMRKVVLVGVNDAAVPDSEVARQYLNNVFGKALITWEVNTTEVTIDDSWDLNGNGKMFLGENNDLSVYPDEAKAFIRAVKDVEGFDVQDDTYYMLFADDVQTEGIGDGDIEGFMPRKKQFGFVFGGGTHTLAHELGHGAFRLAHPWEDYPNLSAGDTDNLMDYGSDTRLRKYQWDDIHDPKWVMTLFDDEEEGAILGLSRQACISSTLRDQLIGTNTFYDPAGDVIKLNSGQIPRSFYSDDEDDDTLHGRLATFIDISENVIYKAAVSDGSFLCYVPETISDEDLKNTTRRNELKWIADTQNPNESEAQLVVINKTNCTYSLSLGENTVESNKEMGGACDCNADPEEEDQNLGNAIAYNFSSDEIEDLAFLEYLYGGSGGVYDYYAKRKRHELKAQLFITDGTTSDNLINLIDEYTPAEGVLKVWLHKGENGNYGLRTDIPNITTLEDFLREHGSLVTFQDVVDGFSNSAEQLARITYEIADFISQGISNLKIPEYVWNCNHESYQPEYAAVYRYVTFFMEPQRQFISLVMQDVFSSAGNEQSISIAPKNEIGDFWDGENIDLSQAEFAALCGVYNAAVEILGSVPELVKLLGAVFIESKRQEFIDQFNGLVNYNNEDTGREGVGGAIADIFLEEFDFTETPPCKAYHNTAVFAAQVGISFFTAGSSLAATLGPRLTSVLLFFKKVDDLADFTRALGLVSKLTSSTHQFLIQGTDKILFKIQEGLFMAKVVGQSNLLEIRIDLLPDLKTALVPVGDGSDYLLHYGNNSPLRIEAQLSDFGKSAADLIGITKELFDDLKSLGLSELEIDLLFKKLEKNSDKLASLKNVLESKPSIVNDSNLRKALINDLHKGDFIEEVLENADLVDSWRILDETGIDGLAGKVDNLEIVDDFVKKYPSKLDDLKTTLKETDSPEDLLQSIKRFEEIPTINNTDELIDVLSNVTDVNTVSQLEQKGIKSFFRGTTRSKADGSLFPGNPNSQLNGISTSTDPVRGTIFAIESATGNPNFKGVLQLGLPADLGDLKLVSPNRRVDIELEAIMKTSADDFASLSKVEISVEDARKLVKEVYDIDLPSNLDSTISRELLETLDVSSLEKSLEFYQKALQYNTK